MFYYSAGYCSRNGIFPRSPMFPMQDPGNCIYFNDTNELSKG